MKNNKIYIIIGILCLLLLGSFIILFNKIQETKLKKEIHNISSLDLGKYKYNEEIKCFGGYGKVEEAIKTYLSDYNTNFLLVNNIMNDKDLVNILSVDNYKNDAPEFKNSLEFLDKTEKEYNEKIDYLIEAADNKYINDYIYKYTKNKKYVKLYRKLIKNEAIDSKTTKYKDSLVKHKEKNLKVFKTSKDIINFLVTNKGNWKIEDNVIKFNNNELLNAYNNALNNIKNK